ncbi:hypothetical protein GCM10022403_036840 [Streptomyces coacervatus]|uniref:Terpene synthase n=1 Tax=Streptomyces coacervatus TaxID=647381 RepID=A0ABP7HMF9_9ACTN|nr:terpene synthase family protein [Streptomyces coacervatus]MDF2270893.1 terpene synthase family protein [Streptomyces coacervatus]
MLGIPHRPRTGAPGKGAPAGSAAGGGKSGAVAFSSYGTPTQMRRWCEEQRNWLFGVVHQVASSEQNRMPDVNEYLLHRLPGSAAAVAMAAVEMVTGHSLPAGLIDTPRVRAITEMTGLVISIDNDLLSYPLEQRAMGNAQNIINVLMHHRDLPLDSAISEATALRDTVMLRFLELSAAEEAQAGHAMSLYLESLRGSISGNLTWAPKAPRYAKNFPGGSVTIQITEDTDALQRSLPYSTTAWWWKI